MLCCTEVPEPMSLKGSLADATDRVSHVHLAPKADIKRL